MKRLALSTITFCVCLIILEGGLRLQAYWNAHHEAVVEIDPVNTNFFMTIDPYLGWRNRSNVQNIHQTTENQVPVSIHRKGFRGKEYPYTRTGHFRILVLGDSFVWGYGVEEKDRFTDRLENLFQEKAEVINAGVPGYGLDQSFLFLKEEGIHYRPDLVVAAFSMVDLLDNVQRVNHGIPKPYFTVQHNTLHLQGLPLPPRGSPERKRFEQFERLGVSPFSEHRPFLRFLEQKTHLYPLIRKAFRIPEKEQDALGLLLLEAMQEQCESIEASLVVLLIPLAHNVTTSRSLRYRSFLTHIKKRGIAVVDPYEDLKKLHATEKVYVKTHGHWTAEGHRVVSDILYDFIWLHFFETPPS